METLTVGQADDLKYEDSVTRIWLSRCTVEDGEPCNNKVTIEELRRVPGKYSTQWVEVGWYEAL